MDLDVCAGGNSTKGKADSAHAGEGGAMATVPLELYDSARAKIDANLRWLLAKAYGIDHIPEDLCDPFYTDQYEQEHIKPPVIRLLLSGELYCRVCGLILKGEQASALQSHLSVIQALSRKGIYVLESDNNPVSDGDLDCSPIKMHGQQAVTAAAETFFSMLSRSVEEPRQGQNQGMAANPTVPNEMASRNSEMTPSTAEELELIQAGLGKKIPESLLIQWSPI